jgi:OFA family oxalate/formate antiporter-like MFS transporter
MATAVATNPTEPRVVNRWVQMIAGVFAMMAIANLQYAWTLFTKPLMNNLHATLAAVQVTFAAFIIAETWLVPFEGYLIDRLGPRRVIAIGGILVGLGWIGSGYAQSLHSLYFWYVAGGVGAGAVYGGCIGNALKWFPDHRGLTAGFTSGAYGIGTALTVAPIAAMLKSSGYQKTFVTWGFIQGAVVIIAAMFIVAPPKGWLPKGWSAAEALTKVKVRTSTYDMTHWQMLKTPAFYVIYIMMTLVAFGGLVVTAQIAPIARFYNVDKVIIAWGMSALVLAIEVDRILNGLTRPFWGWVSDHIGRENTMFIAFLCEATAVFALLHTISRPIWFILLSGLCFFAWGEIFSLFPSITGDLFGKKWATTNYGIVYTSKGLASIFAGPVAALASVKTGSWVQVFYAMVFCDVLAAFLALFWLKPVAKKTFLKAQEMQRLEEADAARAAAAAARVAKGVLV